MLSILYISLLFFQQPEETSFILWHAIHRSWRLSCRLDPPSILGIIWSKVGKRGIPLQILHLNPSRLITRFRSIIFAWLSWFTAGLDSSLDRGYRWFLDSYISISRGHYKPSRQTTYYLCSNIRTNCQKTAKFIFSRHTIHVADESGSGDILTSLTEGIGILDLIS